MLTKDYTKRCYASEALNDPWFKNAKATKVDDAIVKQTLNNMKKFNEIKDENDKYIKAENAEREKNEAK